MRRWKTSLPATRTFEERHQCSTLEHTGASDNSKMGNVPTSDKNFSAAASNPAQWSIWETATQGWMSCPPATGASEQHHSSSRP